MSNITDEILKAAISSQSAVFDTHAVIRAIMKRAPRAYADDLGGTQGDDPILTLHANIGTRLAHLDDLIEKTKRVLSPNVRGDDTENQQWKKEN